jgi:CheY-like chemotaxis protein/HPt (histidine-containing phosphotransfer) domain-containing protein
MTDHQPAAAPARKLKILVTEDNLVNRVLAQKLLEKFGHTVTLATNGKEGAALWSSNPPRHFDVLLMDIQMPIMDGLQATAYIRAREIALNAEPNPENSAPFHIPIVAMTAHAMKGDRERYLAGGMDDYISKPIHPPDLEKVIQSVITRLSAPAPAPVLSPADAAAAVSSAANLEEVSVTKTEESEILAHFEGDAELVRELAEIFLRECPRLLGDLRAAIQSGDAPALQRAAHSLKGSVGNFSTSDAHSSAHQLEMLGKLGSTEGAAQVLAVLEAQLQRFNQILSNLARETAQHPS